MNPQQPFTSPSPALRLNPAAAAKAKQFKIRSSNPSAPTRNPLFGHLARRSPPRNLLQPCRALRVRLARPELAAADAMAAEKLRDLSQPIDVRLLDATVSAFYGTGSREEVTATPEPILCCCCHCSRGLGASGLRRPIARRGQAKFLGGEWWLARLGQGCLLFFFCPVWPCLAVIAPQRKGAVCDDQADGFASVILK